MSFILNWLNNRSNNKLVTNKNACMEHLDKFVDKLFSVTESPENDPNDNNVVYSGCFSDLFTYFYEWLNKDSNFGFHDQYISTLTISLIGFLKSTKNVEDRKQLTKNYLENVLDMIIEDGKHSLYDYPGRSREVYKY